VRISPELVFTALEKRRGKNIATVAMANKTARILRAVMTKPENHLEAA
jgi:hypothetical protein